MRILLVGALSNYAIERYYLKYLNEVVSIEADIFNAQKMFTEFHQKNIFNKIIFRLGYKKIYKTINTALKEKINNYKPDILFVFKGMEIFPETLQWAKDLGIKSINYNPDNPFIFSGRGSGNSNVSRSISLYDLHFTYNLKTKKGIEEEYNIPTYFLPFGFDIPLPLYKSATEINEIVKVCFVGNPDKKRASLLKSLADSGIEIDVYGIGWKRFINHPKIKLLPPVYDDELWLTLRKYRIQLNPLRMHNVDSHGMRSFEVPGIGGIMLAPRTSEHLQFFEEDVEAFFYKDYQEAGKKVKYLLSMPKNKSDEIRNAARKKSVDNKYDYKSRVEFVIKVLKNLEC